MTVEELKQYLDNFSDDTIVVVQSEGRSKADYIHSGQYFGVNAVIIEGN